MSDEKEALTGEEMEKVAGGWIINGKTYTCQYCGETFWSTDILIDHINVMHGVQKNQMGMIYYLQDIPLS